MKCSEVENQLDDYLEPSAPGGSGLDDRAAADIALHIQGCPQCQTELERRQTLLDALRSLPVPQPGPGFFEQAVANAAQSANRNRRRTDSPVRQPYATALTGLAAALLAAVLLAAVAIPDHEATAPESGLPGIHLATGTVTPVKLAFSAEKALQDARLSVSLPVGVELVGYDGRSDISWTTDLEQGTNVLRLPLVGRTAASDILVARLDHPTGTKTFRLQVTVNQSGASNDD